MLVFAWNEPVNKAQMTYLQLAMLEKFVSRMEASGASARGWDDLLERDLPCRPEGHAERDELGGRAIVELDLEAQRFYVLITPRGALSSLSFSVAYGERFDALLDVVSGHVDVSLDGFIALVGEVHEVIGEFDVSVGASTYAASALRDGGVDFAERAQDFSSLYDAALVDMDAGFVARAVEQLELLVEHRPDFVEAQHNLAAALSKLERQDAGAVTERAVSLYTRHIERDPEDPYPRYWLAALLATTGAHDGAFEQLQRAIELEPDYLQEARVEPDFASLRTLEAWRARFL